MDRFSQHELQLEPSGLEWAHPLVREWFVRKFGTPTEPQQQGWPEILSGRTTLISAPTGSGKTLAAFLVCIDRLVRKAISGDLRDETEVLYVSPLKALGNDIQKNLDAPLAEILQLAGESGYLMPEIRTAVRTGDTLMHQRAAMLRRPPHILVTTPESLYILLTAAKSREILRSVRTVIVDEIHAVADDKRGSHLALSLERLEALTEKPPVRIGLSATQKPIELVAQFLAGERPLPVIVQVAQRREFDLAVEVPPGELGAVASNEMWDDIYKRLGALVDAHRSTLIFVNTRRLAERVAHHLRQIIGEDAVACHHGSLSRLRRLEVENKLKSGELRALVATASLELGIDIGSIDLVCQIGSPRSIAVALQRVGRAGHWRGATPKGRIFATTRDELIECAALVHAIRLGDLDRLEIPEAPLDVLAQQIVAACAAEEWLEDDLFAMVRRAYPYRNFTREQFNEVIEMLADGIAARRGRYGAYLHRDRVNGRVRARRGARIAAITSGGAIPETALYPVVAQPEGITVGTVDEDFAVESLAGDIILLGNTSWKIRSVRGNMVLVEDAHGAAPTIPFWRGEAPARTLELSAMIGELREQISELAINVAPGFVQRLEGRAEARGAIDWLMHECGLDQSAAEQAVEYVIAGRAVLGAVPTQQTIVAERFFDESGGMQLVIHAPFGGRINKAWGLALRKRFCRSFNFELQAAATDNGINIALSDQHSFPLADVFHFLHSATAREVLEQAVLASPIFAARWRWAAGRALALLRFMRGKKVPPQIQRMRSDDLLASVFPQAAACQENIVGDIEIPAHPLVREAMRDALSEAMDIDGLNRVLDAIGSGEIRCIAIDTSAPSVFSHEILNANPFAYLDDAPLEERRARAVEMRRMLPEAVLGDIGRLDPAAIAEVRAEAWPDVRDADELHDALLTLIALPEDSAHSLGAATFAGEEDLSWREHFEKLVASRRASRATLDGGVFWLAAEKAKTFAAIYPQAQIETVLPEIESAAPSRDDAILALVTGWMSHLGPAAVSSLARILALPAEAIEAAMLRLESQGIALRGNFTGAHATEIEWCDRRLLARIHRITLGNLRREIEPVSAAQFMRWLLRWQHTVPGSQSFGERGTLETIRQLQGFEAPATAWERHIFPARIANYDPKVLDQLCLTGAVGWGRLSPHPATLEDGGENNRRVIPTSAAPIAFFVREDSDWMMPQHPHASEAGSAASEDPRGLSANAREVLRVLRQHGASFFPDIVRASRKLKSEVETALWELVAAGLITADGFDNMRALISPKRRSGHGSGKSARPRHSAGRWSLLYTHEPLDRAAALESTCWMLLRRYGVVFREVLARESILPKWRELLITFRRLEDRGEIRGGRFVSGYLGEQFALPMAVESLRAARKLAPAGERITLSAADPLNLIGALMPGERVPAISGRSVAFVDGIPAPAADEPIVIAHPLAAG
jgi:ATP-dependent helicase Lhr and Lhr-like helicase